MLFLFAGLGNPGGMYAGTRHNVGRDFLLTLARDLGIEEWREDKHSEALVTFRDISYEDAPSRALFVLPETFMNRSGDAVHKCARKHTISLDHIVVIHDDIDLPLRTVRISKGRGAGGHHGVESVIRALGTKHFIRVRIGVCPVDEASASHKPTRDIVADYVLKRFLPNEEAAIAEAFEKARQAIELIVKRGAHAAMERINGLP